MKQYLTPKNILIVLYVTILASGYFFVKSTLEEKTLKVEERKKDEKVYEVKPVRVNLSINSGRRTQNYEQRVQNNQTILDLLEHLRQSNEITYQKLSYAYGLELEMLNGIRTSETHKWKVFLTVNESGVQDQIKNLSLSNSEAEIFRNAIDNKLEVTNKIDSISLVDDAQIEVVYTKK